MFPWQTKMMFMMKGYQNGKEKSSSGIYSPEDRKNLAATYSPADELQYHRREGVLLPCSGWERVSPPCYGHQEIMADMIRMIRFGEPER